MKRVTYVGKPCMLGRFGKVEQGTELLMRETEYQAMLKNDPTAIVLDEGKPLNPLNPVPAPEPALPVAPEGTVSGEVSGEPSGGEGSLDGSEEQPQDEETGQERGPILPIRTDFYDLSTIDWNVPETEDGLNKHNRTILQHIATAINSLGGEIPLEQTRKELIAEILTFAEGNGWTTPA